LKSPAKPGDDPFAPPRPRGSAERELAAAAVRHQGEYHVPIEHHNPMELYASTVVFEQAGKLTIYDKTQGVQNVQRYVANVLGMAPDEVRVMSPYVGGAFGSGLRPQYQTLLAALAARALKRSVRLVLTRQQMYVLGYRPAMTQQIQLGGERRWNAGCDCARSGHGHVAVRELLPAGDRLVWFALQV
jgi:xanthine dehydrogenase YagR molybdenum-binding subunit